MNLENPLYRILTTGKKFTSDYSARNVRERIAWGQNSFQFIFPHNIYKWNFKEKKIIWRVISKNPKRDS